MNPTTLTQSSFIIEETGSVIIAGNVSLNGATASFNPTNALLINTTYVGTVKTVVKDIDGNALQEDYVFTFSTGSTVTPVVASTDPLDLATNVFLNKTVAANFNMLMNHTSINTNTFLLRQGTTDVAGEVAYINQVACFNPTNNLLDNTEYTATITTGARNVQGTALVSDYTWTFTTGTVAGPTVISTDPINNASGVALNKVITAEFSEPMDNTTINSTSFTLKNGSTVITGTLSYYGTTLTFIPASPLLEATTYTGTITTDAENTSGVALVNNYVWNFNTLSTGGTMVDLQSVARFGIIAGVAVSNNAGFSEIRNMDVGIYPGVRSSLTGFPPAVVVNGAIFASDDTAPAGVPAMLLQAKDDLTAAYLYAEGASSPAPATVSGDQGGTTLAPGIYKSTSTLLIQSGDLTLDAQGDPNATWIFQIASDFTTVGGAGGDVILAGGAKAKNVFTASG
ncbi:Ig-like domain-containing protein [Lacinutrix neustonica]|uniref:Ig-like domain-containing protein n=1 Tax=Lacinutrix neustonica TaxID=2980107 RepID=A0A9E8SEU1_9FLAO|nr:Ig-like domain-containing protein [Lacinutrix neustonica]WAC03107.1 Ig-like domain-containing protein [Lacinutrix neustonica]